MHWNDLRYALRTLVRTPVFTIVALAILAVGTSGIATSFSVVDAFLLADPPFEAPDRLVHFYRTDPQSGADQLRFSLPTVRELATDPSLASLGAYFYTERNLSDGDAEPEHVIAGVLTDNLLETLGSKAALGRAFRPGDGEPGAAKVALLDWGLWTRRYAASPQAVGQTLYLDGSAYEIVGVMPAEFRFPYGEVKIWTATALDSPDYGRDSRNFQPVGRLAEKVDPGAARASLEALFKRTETELSGEPTDFGLRLVPLRQALLFLYDQIRLILLLVLVANAFVLLIICANLASLLIARAVGREKETVIRAVLGAGRRELARLFLAEGSILAVLGGALGMILTGWLVHLADASLPEALFRAGPLRFDGRVLAVVLAVVLLTTVLLAVAPALQAAGRGNLAARLGQARSQAGGRSAAGRSRNLLVVVQVATAGVLLVGTGLMLRTVAGMRDQSLGFSPRGVLTMGMHLPAADYPDEGAVRAAGERIRTAVLETPGVAEAAFVDPLPLNFASVGVEVSIEGREPARPGERLQPGAHWVGPGYFAAMEQTLLRGRGFEERDRADTPPVIVVNRSFAAAWLGDADPIGQRVRIGSDPAAPWSTIVGLVPDSKAFFAHEDVQPLVFLPATQNARRSSFLVVRTAGPPGAAFPSIRAAIDRVDSRLPLSDVRTMDEVVEGSMMPWQGTARGLALLASLALLLAGLGLYGVAAQTAASRTQEIGVRRALGASARDILRRVLGHGVALVVVGLALGLAAGLALGRLLGSLLFGVGALDPITYAAVAAVLLVITLVALAVPALRALRVDPMEALRYE